jgi:hypothetical protein
MAKSGTGLTVDRMTFEDQNACMSFLYDYWLRLAALATAVLS